MQEIDRALIFEGYEKIRFEINSLQKILFDFDPEVSEAFDALNYPIKSFERQTFSLMVVSEKIEDHAKNLYHKLRSLLEYLGIKQLVIISHLKMDFFGNVHHSYFKVAEAYNKLAHYFPKKTFKEAIKVDVNEIENLVEIFFILERFDASTPEFTFWFDEQERFCFYFCKYGNIHFISFADQSLITKNELEKLGFLLDDYDQFARNAIEGRQTEA